MTRAARSVFWFGLYLIAAGSTLVLAPNVLLAPLGFATPDEPWIRVAGMLTLLLGYYFVQCARAELRRFLELTTHVRFAVPLFFAAFVAFGSARPALLLFATADLAGAIWTTLALRADTKG
jgi:hypothetical protein